MKRRGTGLRGARPASRPLECFTASSLSLEEIVMHSIPLRSRTMTGLAFQRWLVQRLAALASAG